MQNSDQPPADPVSETLRANWLFDRLPEWVMDTLSTKQKEAIHEAVNDTSWQHPPVNIRVGFWAPFIRRHFYVTLVAGRDKRDEERRHHERHRYPLRTVANIFFVLGVTTVVFLAGLVALALHSAIVEF